jgi:hypothetical protein
MATNFLDERVPARLWALVVPCAISGCWIWIGKHDRHGYGRAWLQNKERFAHRVFYELLVAAPDPEKPIDHKCRVRCCCNPAHLEVVPHQVNALRRSAVQPRKTHCPNGHPYSGDNLIVSKRGYPQCRACQNASHTARYERRRDDEETCTQCGEPRVPGSLMCKAHRDKNRQVSRDCHQRARDEIRDGHGDRIPPKDTP